jgi:Mg2+ and Co2+ transporter CorA
MQEKKKELLKQFKAVIEDMLDNYEKYTDEEKAQVKEIFEQAAKLNAALDKYDVELKFSWEEYLQTVGQYFDARRF